MAKGQLVRINEARGFGFIESPEHDKDVFVHFSKLKHLPRKAQVGDTLHFSIATDPQGRLEAYNVSFDGQPAANQPGRNKGHSKKPHGHKPGHKANRRPNKPRHARSKRTINKAATLIALGFIIVYALSDTFTALKPKPENKQSPTESQPAPQQSFSCQGKQHCSQMTSCEEARYYLQNCPNVKIDGDRDGVPCERQWCTGFK